MERSDAHTPYSLPTQHRWSRFFTWPRLMALFAVLEMLAICTRHYDPFYIDRIWPQISMPLTIAFAALAFSKAELRRHTGTLWMVAYFLWYLAVLILNRWFLAYEFADFRLVLYRLLFTTMVCFPVGLTLGRRKRLARAVFSTITAVFALLSAIGMFCVLAQTPWYTPYGHGMLGLGNETSTGLRLYLFAHPNIAAAALTMTLLLSLYLCLTARRRVGRLWHGVSCILMFVALGLTASRTSMMAASAALALLPFLAIWCWLKPRSLWLAWGAAPVSAALAAALCFVCLNLVSLGTMRLITAAIPNGELAAAISSVALAETPVDTADIAEVTEVEASDIAALVSSPAAEPNGQPAVPVQREFSGVALHSVFSRERIWQQAMDTVAANPRILIRGTTLERLMLVVPLPPTNEHFVHLHSSYLTVLLSMGAVGAGLALCFLLTLGYASLRRAFSADASIGLGERFLPAVFIACLLIGVMEPFFFTGQYFMDRLLYLLAGYVIARNAAERSPIQRQP